MNRSRAVSEFAAEAIRELIHSGAYAPGALLPSQRELAEQLGVSRTSLREALSALASRGEIRVHAGKGVFVAEPPAAVETGTSEIGWSFAEQASPAEIFQLRYGIEGFVAGLAVARTTPEVLDALADNVEALRRELRAEAFDAANRLDFDFHQQLIELSGNRAIAELIGRSAGMFLESQKLPFLRRERVMETHAEHLRILRALQRQSATSAMRAMQEHIRRAAARIGVQFATPA
ncbi:FadR/GntR family transcriptional regulator [Plasticicumulans acidivorans]|uniref:GntR family transcriptional regulator n=1 Tax=Plasticicumulans acidivorans TaxID=886464 RepID=A0A317MZD1_9GAMM|nr:FCD domain-containing protein [Plasticicumulans acidivorans]PWV65595.1 GntR family transcriptional regulator [Plasticicumulans acidivorans]